jgi:hypothetical protein
MGQRIEVSAGAHDAGQAKYRCARIAIAPFADTKRQTIPGGNAMDYRVHCTSSVGAVSPRRAR